MTVTYRHAKPARQCRETAGRSNHDCVSPPGIGLGALIHSTVGPFISVAVAPRRAFSLTASPRSARPRGRREAGTAPRLREFNTRGNSGMECMLRGFRAISAPKYVALRNFNVCSPRMDIYWPYTEVLIRRMERITAGQPPPIFVEGLQAMDFAYTTDTARANLLATTSAIDEGVYSVAIGVETSSEGLAKALVVAMGSDLNVEYGRGLRVKSVTRRLVFTDAPTRDLGFTATVKLVDGLRQLVNSWRAERALEAAPAGALV
jgi:hypothetical protein